MTTTTILACHTCKRPVGHTKKEDAAVHILYSDIHRAEAELRAWDNQMNTDPCPACEKPAITVEGAGRFHLDGSDNQSCAATPSPGFRIMPASDFLAAPNEARWRVHCDTCNPHGDGEGGYCNGCYWFDAHRMRTWEQAASWTAHLADKDWFHATNWGRFLQSFNPVDA